MKKFLALTLALLMLLAVFCSCNDEAADDTETETETEVTTEPETEADSDSKNKEPWKPSTDDNGGEENEDDVNPDAPATLANGAAFTTLSITDGVYNTGTDAGTNVVWVTQTQTGIDVSSEFESDGVTPKYTNNIIFTDKTKTAFDNGAVVSTAEYSGILFKIDGTNSANKSGSSSDPYFQFLIRIKDGTATRDVAIKSSSTVIDIYTQASGWFTKTGGASGNFIFPKATVGYVYIPFSLSQDLANAEIVDIRLQNSTRQGVIYSDFSFVKVEGGGTEEQPSQPSTPTVPETATTPPAKMAGDKNYTSASITDGKYILTTADTASAWVTSDAFTNKTFTIFDGDKTVNVSNWTGIMLKIDGVNAKNSSDAPSAEPYFRICLKVKDGDSTKEIWLKSSSTDIDVYTAADGWTVKTGGGSGNFIFPKDSAGYAYIPFSVSTELASTDVIVDVKVYNAARKDIVYSEINFVKVDGEDQSGGDGGTIAPTLSAPTVLADGMAITLTSITDGTLENLGDNQNIEAFATELSNKTYCIFDNGATVKLSDYKGFLVKITPTGTKAPYLRLVVKLTDGTNSTTITVYGKLNQTGDARNLDWYNGSSWTTYASGTGNWQTTTTEGYAYLPFSLAEFTGYENYSVEDIKIYSAKRADGGGVFSDWCLVK